MTLKPKLNIVQTRIIPVLCPTKTHATFKSSLDHNHTLPEHIIGLLNIILLFSPLHFFIVYFNLYIRYDIVLWFLHVHSPVQFNYAHPIFFCELLFVLKPPHQPTFHLQTGLSSLLKFFMVVLLNVNPQAGNPPDSKANQAGCVQAAAQSQLSRGFELSAESRNGSESRGPKFPSRKLYFSDSAKSTGA